MKLFHLIVHQKTFSEEDLLINPKDYQEAKEGDIVEIFHPSDDDNPRLLLQIKAFKDDLSSKDTISVEQSIASAFGLHNYKDISMRIVNPADVALDSIELTFKDQYMGRSEMWRLKNSLVYLTLKIWADMSIQLASPKSVRLTAIESNGEIKVFLVMSTTEDINKLYKHLDERLKNEINRQKHKKVDPFETDEEEKLAGGTPQNK